ncbi:MAG: HNH endonuclease signature motif containing protein [Elusimicrobiota bacterium]
MENQRCESLSDEALLSALKSAVADERRSLTAVLRHLAETDRRKLYARAGAPSMFVYCIKELRYSECAAARRIHAARAARAYPVIFGMLTRGSISLSTVSLLAPLLTPQNHIGLLARSAGKSKREVDKLLAGFRPQPETVDRIRYVGAGSRDGPAAPGPTGSGPAETDVPLLDAERLSTQPPPSPTGHAASIGVALHQETPLGPAPGAPAAAEPGPALRVHFSFTADETLLEKIERAKELLRHRHPDGRLAEVFEAALDALLNRLDPGLRLARKAARKVRSGPDSPAETTRADSAGILAATQRSRRIPQWVKDRVWDRDEGRCAFLGPGGARCGERGMLEFDHILPWACGGRSDDPVNIRLLCRTHNQLHARLVFGEELVRRKVQAGTAPARQSGPSPP